MAQAMSNTMIDTAASQSETRASAPRTGPRATTIGPTTALDLAYSRLEARLIAVRLAILARDLVLEPRDAHAVAALPDALQPVARARGIERPAADQSRRDAERKPEVDSVGVHAGESLRRNADDGVLHAGDVDRFSENRRVAAVLRLPHLEADDRDMLVLVALLGRSEEASERGAHAEHRHEARRHENAVETARVRAATARDLHRRNAAADSNPCTRSRSIM